MDFYQILGVDKDATPEQIKKAFREKAKKYHPDINPEYSEIFKQITHAYDTLIDPEKRKNYDNLLKRSHKKDLGSFIGDILSDFLGFHSKPVKGEDIKIKLEIPLAEGFNGTAKKIIYKRKVRCKKCSGSGVNEHSKIKKCEKCGGSGKIKKGFVYLPCIRCFGKGYRVINPCSLCRGSGRVIKKEEKKIKIPAGVLNGQTLVLEKGGNHGINGGESGDLFIEIKLRDEKYKLKKTDLITKIYIKKENLKDNRYISITDIEGNRYRLDISQIKGITKYRLKGRGYRDMKGNRGDLIVKVVPV